MKNLLVSTVLVFVICMHTCRCRPREPLAVRLQRQEQKLELLTQRFDSDTSYMKFQIDDLRRDLDFERKKVIELEELLNYTATRDNNDADDDSFKNNDEDDVCTKRCRAVEGNSYTVLLEAFQAEKNKNTDWSSIKNQLQEGITNNANMLKDMDARFKSGGVGNPGPPGPKGPNGEKGPSGPPGRDGMLGQKGDSGEPGRDGNNGLRGLPGQTGDKGEPGPIGVGNPGPPGPKGPNGEKGPSGPPGRDGMLGQKGDSGEPGRDGNNGLRGLPGQTGDKGEPGPIGPRGLPGPAGIKGPTGPKGDQGPRGTDGRPGMPGPQGSPGHPGRGRPPPRTWNRRVDSIKDEWRRPSRPEPRYSLSTS